MKQSNVIPESVSGSHTLVLRSQVSEMPRFYEFVEGLRERHHLSEEFSMEVQLALEEAIVNVMHYSHPGSEELHDIRLDTTVSGSAARFVLSDDGVPFDPTQHKEVDIDAPLDARMVGGLGIHLVRNLMDTIEYHRENERNVLTLTKQIK